MRKGDLIFLCSAWHQKEHLVHTYSERLLHTFSTFWPCHCSTKFKIHSFSLDRFKRNFAKIPLEGFLHQQTAAGGHQNNSSLAINTLREKKLQLIHALFQNQRHYEEAEVWPLAHCGGSSFLLNVCLLCLSLFQELKAESHILPTQTQLTAAPFVRSHLVLISRTSWLTTDTVESLLWLCGVRFSQVSVLDSFFFFPKCKSTRLIYKAAFATSFLSSLS